MPHSIEEYPTRRNGNAFFKEMYYLLTNIKCCSSLYTAHHMRKTMGVSLLLVKKVKKTVTMTQINFPQRLTPPQNSR